MSRDETKRRSHLELELAAAGDVEMSSWTEAQRREAEALGEENRALLAGYDVNAFARAVDARVREARGREALEKAARRRRRLAALVPAVAGLAAVLVLMVRPPVPEDVIRVKSGGVTLLASRVSPTGIEPLGDGASASAGDIVQLQVVGASAAERVVVVSLDGRGAVTLHFPKSPDAGLGPKGELPSSFALDDAPRFERFFVVAGPALTPEAVLQAARLLAVRSDAMSAPLPLDAPSQQSLLVRKEVLP